MNTVRYVVYLNAKIDIRITRLRNSASWKELPPPVGGAYLNPTALPVAPEKGVHLRKRIYSVLGEKKMGYEKLIQA